MPAKSDESPAKTSLYQEFLAEREEILKHKWIQSEEAGHDVGLETTLVEWALHHRASRKEHARTPSRP